MIAEQSLPLAQRARGPLTLVDIVRTHSERVGEETAFIFLKNGDFEDGVLTFAALDERARSIAAELQDRLTQGDRAILLFPPGLEFIVAFLGCMYAGVVAVPANLPRKQQGLERLSAIAGNCSPKVIMTNEAARCDLVARLQDLPALAKLQMMTIEAALGSSSAPADTWRPPQLAPTSIAFLQYTSGATGTPKGVAVKHGSLLVNEQMITEGFGHNTETIGLGWLPSHHDMGLVGNILNPLYVGFPCILMSPIAFAQQPVRWLQAISKYRATSSGGPNFAYDVCVRRITTEQMQGLDLTCWRVAFSGAEPVRAETLARFSEKFSLVGFRREAFYPCYGLAEATLFASGPVAGRGAVIREVSAAAIERNEVVMAQPSENSEARRALVGCGGNRGDQRILIVDPESRLVCPDRVVGEIWLQGSNVADGYWSNEAATTEIFNGHLADSGKGPFLRTGDLGFLDDGELFITGRRKELIIIKGRNLYPNDIEDQVARSHRAFAGCSGIAFSLDVGGEEKLIVAHEVSARRLTPADQQEIRMNVREAVANTFDVQVHDLVLLTLGGIPRTTSGKKQRRLCRALYRQGSLPALEVR